MATTSSPEAGCPDCGAAFVERTHGGDLTRYACGTVSSMCTDGCCGGIEERGESCRPSE